MAAGNFTDGQLCQVMVEIDKMWPDNQTNPDYMAHVDVFLAIRAEQTADVMVLEDPNRTQPVKVVWTEACDDEDEACDEDCDFTGAPVAGSNKRLYDITDCTKGTFSVEDDDLRGTTFTREQVVAKSLMRKMKTLDEKIAGKAVAFLNANDGVNTFDNGGLWTIGTNATTIPANDWDTLKLLSKLFRAAKENKLMNAFLLSGWNLWDAALEAGLMNGVNCSDCDKKAASAYGELFKRKYWDTDNIDTLNSGVGYTYMINRGAVAFANLTRNPVTPMTVNNVAHYKIPSQNLPGVWYDVRYKTECITRYNWKHTWEFYTKFEYLLNPLGCTPGRTGILAFRQP